MRINNVPIVFTTTAIDKGFALLPNVASFASSIGRPLRIIHVLGQRYRSYAERQMASAIEALPSGNGLVYELLKIEKKQHRAFLDEIASTTGGILAMLPTRHNFINRLLAMMSDYEKFMIEGSLPLLALPRNGALPNSIERILFPLDLSPRSDDSLEQAADFAKSVAPNFICSMSLATTGCSLPKWTCSAYGCALTAGTVSDRQRPHPGAGRPRPRARCQRHHCHCRRSCAYRHPGLLQCRKDRSRHYGDPRTALERRHLERHHHARVIQHANFPVIAMRC